EFLEQVLVDAYPREQAAQALPGARQAAPEPDQPGSGRSGRGGSLGGTVQAGQGIGGLVGAIRPGVGRLDGRIDWRGLDPGGKFGYRLSRRGLHIGLTRSAVARRGIGFGRHPGIGQLGGRNRRHFLRILGFRRAGDAVPPGGRFLRRGRLLALKETEHRLYTEKIRPRPGTESTPRNGGPRMKKHQIRIVGGAYRRTPISVPPGDHLRPTPVRVRETLFNWLAHFWDGSFAGRRVLDLFAGTGALGFEAASRGVETAQLVEQAPAALAGLRAVQARLRSPAIRIHAGDACAFLRAQPAPSYD